MLKKSASGVLSPVSPCDVPSGYASVAPLPAALLDGLFEHPAKAVLYCATMWDSEIFVHCNSFPVLWKSRRLCLTGNSAILRAMFGGSSLE